MPVIDVKNLHKRYVDRVAVHNVSFAVQPGDIFGIIGPTAPARPATVGSSQGLPPADSGRARVLGLDPVRDRRSSASGSAYPLQESQLPDKIKVWEALDLYLPLPDPADPARLLDDLGSPSSAT